MAVELVGGIGSCGPACDCRMAFNTLQGLDTILVRFRRCYEGCNTTVKTLARERLSGFYLNLVYGHLGVAPIVHR